MYCHNLDPDGEHCKSCHHDYDAYTYEPSHVYINDRWEPVCCVYLAALRRLKNESTASDRT